MECIDLEAASFGQSIIQSLGGCCFARCAPDSTVRLFMQIRPVDLKNMKVSAPWEWSRPAELHRELMEDFTRLHARNLSI